MYLEVFEYFGRAGALMQDSCPLTVLQGTWSTRFVAIY